MRRTTEQAPGRGGNASPRASVRVGAFVLVASLLGTIGIASSASASATATTPLATTTTLTSSAPSSVVGQSVAFTATVRAGAVNPAGTVRFFEGTTILGSASLYFGKFGVAVASLGAGAHVITASYGGSGSYAASVGTFTQTVGPAATAVTVSSSASPSVLGQHVTLSATVATLAPGAGSPVGTMTFAEGLTTLGTAAAYFGKYSLALPTLPVGDHQISATFSASASFASGVSTFTQRVQAATTDVTVSAAVNPVVLGQSVRLLANVTSRAPGSGTPTGTVTFLDGAARLGTSTHWFGGYSLLVSSVGPGTHTITAAYGGSASYAPSSASFALQVGRAPATLILLAPAPPTVAGQVATLDASVVGLGPNGPTPTGVITFAEGSTSLGSAPILTGHAALSLPTLSVGSHQITASYAGDTNFQSVSVTTARTIDPARSDVSVVSSASPSTLGSPATLTASVRALAPGAGTVTGTVVFTEGGAELASVPVVGGTAAVTLPDLAPGDHRIDVAYSGDGSFGAAGVVFVQRVVLGSATTVVSSASPSA
ncbi:MAG: hypothetical protein JWN46_365, partial [Acidimicrobiales bacterium]|nr:hypothetical protein [Acidimicrobiales bacterium]